MSHKLLTVILFAGTMVSGGHADEPTPEKQVAVLSEQHRKAAINGDTKVLDAVVADDWVVVGPTGEVDTKRQQEKKTKDKKQAGRWRCVFNQVTPVAGPPAEKR